MGDKKKPQPPRRYKEDTLLFGTDDASNGIVYRPKQLLVWLGQDAERDARLAQVNNLLVLAGIVPTPRQGQDPTQGEIDEGTAADDVAPAASSAWSLDVERTVNRGWSVLAPSDGEAALDPVRAGRILRSHGIPAQPNHVYFVNSLGQKPGAPAYGANPNTFGPNTFGPNTFGPNTFGPNTFGPNTFGPNTFGPNTFGSMTCVSHVGRGADCCCADGITRGELGYVPELSARPVLGPDEVETPLVTTALDIKIFVLDARRTITSGARDENEVMLATHLDNGYGGGVNVIKAALKGLPGVMLGRLYGFLKRLAVDGPGNPSAELDRRAALLKEEPTSMWQGTNSDGAEGDRSVDPVTGHQTFIEHIIERIAGSIVTSYGIAGTLGDVSDSELCDALDMLAEDESAGTDSVRILNLSLSGYNENDQPSLVLAASIKQLQDLGWLIVASAGNYGSCRPAWPAAMEGVVAVAAVGPYGPAPFSNYGGWVDACAPGVDIVSKFPNLNDLGSEAIADLDVTDDLLAADFSTDWATWSGTSFSAPVVAARLAVHMMRQPAGRTRDEMYEAALEAVILDPTLLRIHQYGTVVNSG